MAKQLSADAAIEAAIKQTGLDDFGGDGFREGLELLVDDINRDPRPDALLDVCHEDFIKLLGDRLKVEDYLKKHPELLARPVEKPIFVLGIPRTGTTLLSNLLAADPARRSPLTWEIDDPVPPATSATLKTDPRAVARLEAERQLLEAHPEAGKYYRNSAIYPNECAFIFAHNFKSVSLECRGRLPKYRDWLYGSDMTSTYEYHKKFLQLLQGEAPGVWNLKMPSHSCQIETILKVYPDARLIWTHRDPYTATGSLCSLLSLAHRGYLGEIDYDWLGKNYTPQAVMNANRAMDSRERIGHDRIVDVQYADMIRDPIGTMRNVYAAIGDDFTPEAEAGMQAWVDVNPQNKFGKHEYKLAQFGLSVEMLEPMYERYLASYDVEREG